MGRNIQLPINRHYSVLLLSCLFHLLLTIGLSRGKYIPFWVQSHLLLLVSFRYPSSGLPLPLLSVPLSIPLKLAFPRVSFSSFSPPPPYFFPTPRQSQWDLAWLLLQPYINQYVQLLIGILLEASQHSAHSTGLTWYAPCGLLTQISIPMLPVSVGPSPLPCRCPRVNPQPSLYLTSLLPLSSTSWEAFIFHFTASV